MRGLELLAAALAAALGLQGCVSVVCPDRPVVGRERAEIPARARQQPELNGVQHGGPLITLTPRIVGSTSCAVLHLDENGNQAPCPGYGK